MNMMFVVVFLIILAVGYFTKDSATPLVAVLSRLMLLPGLLRGDMNPLHALDYAEAYGQDGV